MTAAIDNTETESEPGHKDSPQREREREIHVLGAGGTHRLESAGLVLVARALLYCQPATTTTTTAYYQRH